MLKFEYLKNLKMAALKIINFCPTEMTYTVSGGALNSTQTKPNQTYQIKLQKNV